MKMRTLLLLALVPAPAYAAAPFCVFGSGPSQCFYWTVESCRDAARNSNGMCAPNSEAQQPLVVSPAPVRLQQPPPMQLLDIAKSMQEAGERGRRQRMEDQEFRARMALLEAQTEAAERQASQPVAQSQDSDEGVRQWAAVVEAAEAQKAAEGYPIFECARQDGTKVYTSTPAAGCVYLGTGH